MSHQKPAEENKLAAPKGKVLVYQAEDGQVKVDVRLEDEPVWLTQQLMAELFQTTRQNISLHCYVPPYMRGIVPRSGRRLWLSKRVDQPRS